MLLGSACVSAGEEQETWMPETAFHVAGLTRASR